MIYKLRLWAELRVSEEDLKLKPQNLQLRTNPAIGMERLLELFVSLWTKATRESPTCNEMEGIAQMIFYYVK